MYELAQGNRIEYAYLGITMTTITPDYALQNNLDPNSHQLIPEVTKALYRMAAGGEEGGIPRRVNTTTKWVKLIPGKRNPCYMAN